MRKISVFLLCLCLYIACKKNDVNSPQPVTPGQVVMPVNMVIASVIGMVTDENGLAFNNVTVSGGGASTITDAAGMFRIQNKSFNSLNASVKIEKQGYFTLVKSFTVKAGGTAFLKVQLLPKTLTGSFDHSTGGTITLPGGQASVIFPSNALTLANGNPYSGTVQVYAQHLAADDANLGLKMPGNLLGVTAPSALSALQTYGMMAVEILGSNGEPLKVADGKKVTLKQTIAATQLSSAPDNMPTWYFDEGNAVWVREGTAIKQGNTYSVDVAHFSFWNYDWPLNQVFLEMTLKSRVDSTPFIYSRVQLTQVNTTNSMYGFTDSTGYASGYIFINEPMRLQAFSSCNTVLIDTIIGPYTANTDLGTLYCTPVPASGSPVYSLSGILKNCSGFPVTNGVVSTNIMGLNYTVPVNANGEYTINSYYCGQGPLTVLVKGTDLVTGQQSDSIDIILFPNSPRQLPALTACTNPPAQYIAYNLDDTAVYTFVRGIDSVFCRTTFAFNRTELSCRRQPGTPTVQGIVSFVTGPTSVNPNDTSAILTLQRFTTASSPSSLNIVSFTESYTSYPPNLQTPGWVIGEYDCTFRDDQNILHRVRANFKMWRE